MIEIIAICLVLITISLIFGSDAAGDLLGCACSLIVLGFVIVVVGGFFLLLIT